MYATLEESHLFVQYPRKFTSIESRERGWLLGSYAFERSGQLAIENETASVAGNMEGLT